MSAYDDANFHPMGAALSESELLSREFKCNALRKLGEKSRLDGFVVMTFGTIRIARMLC
jgi:hypothetical protein